MTRWGEINCPRCEELEAKLAQQGTDWDEMVNAMSQQDDLVQAAVAAALTEAAGIASYHQDWGDVQSAILALITPDAQAALDRVRAAALREAINRVSGCDRISEVQPAILALIRKGGE